MKTTTIAAIVLVIIGVISLAYQGISYTTWEKTVDIGPVEIVHEDRKTIPLPPALGAVALIGGVVLLALGAKKTA